MARLPSLGGNELCRILEKEGFVLKRQTSSHRIYQKVTPDGPVTVLIPVHGNRSLKKGTLYGILKKAGISAEKLAFLVSLVGIVVRERRG